MFNINMYYMQCRLYNILTYLLTYITIYILYICMYAYTDIYKHISWHIYVCIYIYTNIYITSAEVLWVSCHNSIETLSFPQQVKNPVLPISTWHLFYLRQESRVPSLNKRWWLTPLLQLERNPKISVTTREEPWVSSLNLRWGQNPL